MIQVMIGYILSPPYSLVILELPSRPNKMRPTEIPSPSILSKDRHTPGLALAAHHVHHLRNLHVITCSLFSKDYVKIGAAVLISLNRVYKKIIKNM